MLTGVAELCRKSRGDPRIIVAILDGPVDLRHPSLVDAGLANMAVRQRHNLAMSSAAQHGTHVASVIFGQGPFGISGIAPDCRGIIIPIFRDGDQPDSIIPCSQIELATAIDQATDEMLIGYDRPNGASDSNDATSDGS